MSTWIIKQVDAEAGDCCYLSDPGEGSAWGPSLSDAHRFKSPEQAWREVGRLEQEHKRSDWKYSVRRVRSVNERLRATVAQLRNALINIECIAVQYIGEEHGVIVNARDAIRAGELAALFTSTTEETNRG